MHSIVHFSALHYGCTLQSFMYLLVLKFPIKTFCKQSLSNNFDIFFISEMPQFHLVSVQ